MIELLAGLVLLTCVMKLIEVWPNSAFWLFLAGVALAALL